MAFIPFSFRVLTVPIDSLHCACDLFCDRRGSPIRCAHAQHVAAEDLLDGVVAVAPLDQADREQGPIGPRQAGICPACQRAFGPERFPTRPAPLAFALRDFALGSRIPRFVSDVGADGDVFDAELLGHVVDVDHRRLFTQVAQLGFRGAFFHRPADPVAIRRGTRGETVGFEDQRIGVEFKSVLQVFRTWLQNAQGGFAGLPDRLVRRRERRGGGAARNGCRTTVLRQRDATPTEVFKKRRRDRFPVFRA